MSTRLTALDGPPDIVISRNPTLVGRHPLCDVRVGSPRVSRRHCCLTAEAGVVAVRDLGSTNGTRINGRRVLAGWLGPGDELSIADRCYRVGGSGFARTPGPRSAGEGVGREGVALNIRDRW